LVGGLAVAKAIAQVAGVSPGVKWPNDVLLGDRKTAGILAELATVGSSVSHVALGIGINVNQTRDDLPREVRHEATSLRLAAGRPIARAELAAALYNSLDGWYQVYCAGGAERILARLREWSATLGKVVEISDGDERWRGRAVDLDDCGALLVRDEAGSLRRLVAGDVSIRMW
jgi:BirA family biotin operon repressor/biotin-[acetyl-CoA-carboxylase] ligase